jgi:membrane-associated phospholipid phosphatase
LVLLAVVEVVALVAVWRFFVRTEHGQLLDTVALAGNTIGRTHIDSLVHTILNAMSAASLVVATAVIGFIALARRRIVLAFGAVLLIGGANATAFLLKEFITRPQLGVDMERAAAGNSLPSGHTAVAASAAIALMLVLPPRARGIGAVLGAAFIAAAGVATMSAGWHRPSDAVAALLVVGAWACVAGLFIVAAQRPHGGVEYGTPNYVSLLLLVIVGVGLLLGAVIALKLVDPSLATPTDELGRPRLFTAYAGGALEIAGVAALISAAVLATVHRVVPRVVRPGAEDTTAEQVLPVAS